MSQKREDLALLDGAIDMHAHTAPALFPRPFDDNDLAEAATAYKMRGFVLKDHDSSTTGRATTSIACSPQSNRFQPLF